MLPASGSVLPSEPRFNSVGGRLLGQELRRRAGNGLAAQLPYALGFAMEKNQSPPTELHVYECRGNEPPQIEPSFEGYLGLWPEPPFYYLFADRQVLSLVTDWVLEQPGWSIRDQYLLEYDQWQESGNESMEIGSLRIVKGVSADNISSPGKTIVLNPGLVFGNGLHPSTQACLLMIDRYRHQLSGAKVMDLGTGTGVLAIACAKLGAAGVVAVDCNPMAIRETRANVRLNGLESLIHPVLALGLGAFKGHMDWLIMNLEYPVLTQLLQEGPWHRYSTVLLSGFLPAWWHELQRFIPPLYCLEHWLDWQGWCAALLRNPSGGASEKPEVISG
jgi:ribosomal protein L11 methyltransferase